MILIFLALPALADDAISTDAKFYIPFELFEVSKRDQIRENLLSRGDCSESLIDAMLEHAAAVGYMFSIDSVAKSVPTILNSDELNIGCPKSPMQMEFLSVMSSNTVMVRTMRCDMQDAGMECTAPTESIRHFVTEPGKTIELSGGATYLDALKILHWFRNDAGAQLSETEKSRIPRLSWRMAIDKQGDRHTLRIGDSYCECVFYAELDTPDMNADEPIVTIGGRGFDCPGTH